ncbi:MAG: AbrB/MazE/SpoVT family DNA-binding domain-containing protein [Dehalococcoidales bacterium]|nr:AbrB/MazE/SpoVT family DNA-binding domain-containing protein [Dehalococcoidales bacterium]
MPIKVKRGLFKVGEYSLAVILPKAWVDYFELKPGDTVEIIANDHLTIRIDEEVLEKDHDDSN